MGRLKPLARSKMLRILLRNGFQEVRSEKHTTFKKTASDGRILTIWVPRHREITLFVIGYIIKQTEKPREEFES